MLRSTNLITIVTILLLCLPIIACQSGNAAAIVEPTPTFIPTPTIDIWSSDRIPVSHIGQITGTWMAESDLGYFFLRIHPDGTVIIGNALENLDTNSSNSWKIWIEKSLILADDYAICSGDIGTYFAGVRSSDGALKFTTINDFCSTRTVLMDKSQPGSQNEYDLFYTRVR